MRGEDARGGGGAAFVGARGKEPGDASPASFPPLLPPTTYETPPGTSPHNRKKLMAGWGKWCGPAIVQK